MLRKLVSGVLFLALTTIGFSQISPARAEGTFSPVVTLPEGVYGGISIPLGDSDQLKIWQSYTNDGRYLKTGILHIDGTWALQDDIVSAPTSTSFGLAQEASWTVNSEGTIALAWNQIVTTSQNNVETMISSGYVAYTDDGVDWSAPVQVFAPRVIPSNSFQCRMYMECGYSSIQLSVDSKNTITAVSKFYDGSSWSLLVSTSKEGVIWSSPTELENAQGLYFTEATISPLPGGGFMVIWSTGGQSAVLRYSTMSPKTYSVWQRPKSLGSAVYMDKTRLLLTDPTHVSLFFTTSENLTTVLHQRLYNLVTKTWGTSSTLFTSPFQVLSTSFAVALGANWHSAVSVGISQNGVGVSQAYLIELNNSVASEARLVKSATEQTMQVAALRVNFDDSVTLMLHGLNRRANIMNLKTGVTVSDIEVPTTGAEQLYGFGVSVSPSGNIFITSVFNTGTSQIYEGIVYRQASAPIPSGDLRVTGQAKVGKFVTSVAPTFTGLTAIGATSIQWYACTTKVTTIQTTVPSTCVVIPRATALKFKVTSKQKNKYLGVAVKNTNAIGTATVFRTLAAKAK